MEREGMSIECGECERDLRGGHDASCSRYDPAMEACTCDPEWQADCPVHDPQRALARHDAEHAYLSNDDPAVLACVWCQS